MSHTTGTIQSRDGTRLYWRTDAAEGSAIGRILLIHGFGEHSGRYDAVVAGLCALGYTVWRTDVRGHGRSEGARGHVYRYEDYLDDFDAMRKHVLEQPATGPLFVLAHSHGCLISLHALARDPSDVSGIVFSSPFFGVALKVPKLKRFAAKKLSRWIPTLALPVGIDSGDVSHDPAVTEAYATDPLNHGVATPRWFTEVTRAHVEAPAKARDIKLPILVQHAGEDRLASIEATRNVFARLGSEDATFTPYPGLFHEIWFELESERPLGEVHAWLKDHT